LPLTAIVPLLVSVTPVESKAPTLMEFAPGSATALLRVTPAVLATATFELG